MSQSKFAWKVSKYGVISGPYFPAFGLNTERYFVSLRIQSECGKIRTRNKSVFGHFSRSVTYVYQRNISTHIRLFRLHIVLFSLIKPNCLIILFHNFLAWFSKLSTYSYILFHSFTIKWLSYIILNMLLSIRLDASTFLCFRIYYRNYYTYLDAYQNITEAALQRCSYKKVFWKYTAIYRRTPTPNQTSEWGLFCKFFAYFLKIFFQEQLWWADV